MRKTLSRALLIVVTLVVAAIYYLPVGHVDFVENWGEGGFGAINYNRSNVVSKIERGSPADRAGVRVGDLLVENGYLTTSSRFEHRTPARPSTLHSCVGAMRIASPLQPFPSRSLPFGSALRAFSPTFHQRYF